MNVRRLPELTFVLGIVGKFQETSRIKSFSLVQSEILDDHSQTTYMNANFEEISYTFFGATHATRARDCPVVRRQDFLCPLQFCREQSTSHWQPLNRSLSTPSAPISYRISTKSRVRFKVASKARSCQPGICIGPVET